MLFELLMNFILILMKFVFRVLLALVVLPYGVFMLLKEFFPVFSLTYGFWYWTVFGIITILGYYILWRPILWISGISTILDAGND